MFVYFIFFDNFTNYALNQTLYEILIVNAESFCVMSAWQLALKVVSGHWDASTTGHATFWELLASHDAYTSGDDVADHRDFSTSADHFKSPIVSQWYNGVISVQAVRETVMLNYFP